MASKLFWFKFVPADWRKDPDLSRCSLAAKGFWIDAVCILQETEEPGVFKTNGIPWLDREIVAAVGVEHEVGLACLSELLAKGVCSRSRDGAVFARRIVREHQKRVKCIAAGKTGGNPALKRSRPLIVPLKGEVKGQAKGDANHASNSEYIETTESYVSPEAEEQEGENLLKQTKMERQIVFDEHFQLFRRLCESAGEFGCLIAGDEGSWRRAAYEWAALDPSQRMKAIEGIRARIERELWDDPVLKSLPSTVLGEKKYERPLPRLRSSSGGLGTGSGQPAPQRARNQAAEAFARYKGEL